MYTNKIPQQNIDRTTNVKDNIYLLDYSEKYHSIILTFYVFVPRLFIMLLLSIMEDLSSVTSFISYNPLFKKQNTSYAFIYMYILIKLKTISFSRKTMVN